MCHISRRLTLIPFSSDFHKHFALFYRGRQQDRWPNHRTVESVRTTTSELSSANHDDTYATLNYRHTGKCRTLLVNNTMNCMVKEKLNIFLSNAFEEHSIIRFSDGTCAMA